MNNLETNTPNIVVVPEDQIHNTRQLLPNLFNHYIKDNKLILTAKQDLSDASWGAWFGFIQSALRQRVWLGVPFRHCHINLSSCTWADPLPLMSLSVALAEFEAKEGTVSLEFNSFDQTNENDQNRLLKYMAREGFMSLLVSPAIAYLPSQKAMVKTYPKRDVRLGKVLITEELIEKLKEIYVPLAYQRSTCLPATLLHLDCPQEANHIKTLDDIDQWVERKLYEAIAPVVSDLVPGWAQRSVRYRLLMVLREMLHNIAEHAYAESGFAAVYIRYREGVLGEALANRKRLEQFINREHDQWKTPLMEPPSEQESFPKTRSGFFEVFVLDSGKGLCNSLGEVATNISPSPLQKCMLDIFDKGRGRRAERPTQYGGLFLIRQLLEPMHDYLRIRDEDAWWGTELPLKRTEEGSTPKGIITWSARGIDHSEKAIEGVAWTTRLSWLDRTDLVGSEGVWQGLTEKCRNSLFNVLKKAEATAVLNDIAIMDSRFSFQQWSTDQKFNGKSAKIILLLPQTDWMKNHIQYEIIRAVKEYNLAKGGNIIIGDIPSEEAITYLAAIEKAMLFEKDPLDRIGRIVLVTRDIKACILVRDENNRLINNMHESKAFMQGKVTQCEPDKDVLAYYSLLRNHDGRRLWEIVAKLGGAYVNEQVKWNVSIILDGYLDFPQSLIHPVCRGIYTLTLQRLTGFFPRHECTLVGLDGLVDSLVVRFNAEQHPRGKLITDPIQLSIGSVQVSGLTEEFSKEKGSYVFHFFRHKNGSALGRYLLPWIEPTTVKELDSINPFLRVGRTPVVARNGWKSYHMPRFDSNAISIYEQTPKESYRAWQEPSRTLLKMGHWSYGGHHDLLTLNLLVAFDTELDHIRLTIGGSLARFVYANLFNLFGLASAQLNERGKELLAAVKKDPYKKILPETLSIRNALLLYPSHPITDHVLDRFLSLISDEILPGEQASPLDMVCKRSIAVLPIRRHRNGSGLQISGLILDKLKNITEPKPPIVLFDDALISGRTYADIKRLLRSMGFKEIYSLAMVDRQRFPSADHVKAENHYCYWRLDIPSLGSNHNCPLCHARGRVYDLADALADSMYKDRIQSWRDDWRPLNPATQQWGDGGLRPIPLWLKKPERKFSIEPDPDKPGAYRQIGGDLQKIKITNTSGLVAYVSELHSITSHDDLALRIINKEEHLPHEARIQLLASQLLLFSGEFDRDLAHDLGQELMAALWDVEAHDRHTALAVLTLFGCGDNFIKKCVTRFFIDKDKKDIAATRNIDLTLLLALVLLIVKTEINPDHDLDWLTECEAIGGVVGSNNQIEIYGWLHRLVRDNFGKPHSTPLHRLKKSDILASTYTPIFYKEVQLSVVRLLSILKVIMPYWLRPDSDGCKSYEVIQQKVNKTSNDLNTSLNDILNRLQTDTKNDASLSEACILASDLFEKAEKLHDGVFCPLGITLMKKEIDKRETLFLEKLRSLVVESEDKKILWDIPTSYDIGIQIQELNKPGIEEAYVLWDSKVEFAMREILTNVRHANTEIINPWKETAGVYANMWGRLIIKEQYVSIELINSSDKPAVASKTFLERQSISRGFLINSGCTLDCVPYDSNKVATCIHIPYAHTLRV